MDASSNSKKSDSGFRLFSATGCLLLALFSLLFVGIGAGATLAKTGLIHVPVLTKVFYKKGEPTRVIKPSGETSLEEVVLRQISALTRSAQSATSIKLTEDEVTAFIRGKIKDIGASNFKIKDAQVVFMDKEIELYADILEPQETTIKLVIDPSVADGSISITVKRVELGNLRVPAVFFNIAIATILQGKIRDAELMLADSPITGLEIADGILNLGIDPVKLEGLYK